VYIVSIASIILFITKRYSVSVETIYKHFNWVKDIIALKLPKVTREIVSLYQTFLTPYKYY
jgi:hypothetical protein